MKQRYVRCVTYFNPTNPNLTFFVECCCLGRASETASGRKAAAALPPANRCSGIRVFTQAPGEGLGSGEGEAPEPGAAGQTTTPECRIHQLAEQASTIRAECELIEVQYTTLCSQQGATKQGRVWRQRGRRLCFFVCRRQD